VSVIKDRTLIITGPTASGKTGVAERTARLLDGEIVSCDSRMIYRYLNIGTGKVFNSDKVEYHLIDIAEPEEILSTYDLALRAKDSIKDILGRNKTPILCGGSHHIVETILNGIDPGPVPSPSLRSRLRVEEKERGKGHLHSLLGGLDPELALKVHPNNTNRIIRYLEHAILDAKNEGLEPLGGTVMHFHFDRSITTLRERIGRRYSRMVDMGWKEEVQELSEIGITKNMPGCNSIGYPEMFDHMEGKMGIEDAKEKIIRATIDLARKQRKWKRRFMNIRIMDLDEMGPDGACDMIFEMMKESSLN
jgi:tRNA dimethylallyltransferase